MSGYALLIAAVLNVAALTASYAADEVVGAGTSYITPFPPGDTYKLQVYGDDFAEALSLGLIAIMGPENHVDIARKFRPIGQLIRPEHEEAFKVEEQSKDLVHIGVVMIGLEDRGPIRVPGATSIKFGTEAWKDQYGQRVDRLIKALKRRSIAVYVVGQPPLRREEANTDAEAINELMRERAFVNGVRFIEVAESFIDENGDFSQFGLDVTGNRQKLRDGDGVNFTVAGRVKLASLVERDIKRDLATARLERAVPLAGTESEQKRINPGKAAAAAGWKAAVIKDGKDPRGHSAATTAGQTVSSGAPRTTSTQGDQSAENSRIAIHVTGTSGRDEVQNLEILRPAIPAAVIALLARKDAADALQPPFEVLAEDVGDGVSVSTLVTALVDTGSGVGRKRGTANQSNYNAVWVKGERLPTKLGRADDFTWPRGDSLPYTPVPEMPAKAAANSAPATPSSPNTRGRSSNATSKQ